MVVAVYLLMAKVVSPLQLLRIHGHLRDSADCYTYLDHLNQHKNLQNRDKVYEHKSR